MTILLARHGEIVSRRRCVNGALVVVTHGLVCRALVGRHALLPEGVVVPALFHNTSVTVLHENVPHSVSLLNCTRHLVTGLEERNGGSA
jgi:probable phosphoglycerate mutase